MSHLQAPGSVKFIALAPVRRGCKGDWEMNEEMLSDCNPGRSLILAAGIAAEILFEGIDIRTKEGADLFDEFYWRDDTCSDLCFQVGERDEPIWYRFWWEVVIEAFCLLSEHVEALVRVGSQLLETGFIGRQEIATLMGARL